MNRLVLVFPNRDRKSKRTHCRLAQQDRAPVDRNDLNIELSISAELFGVAQEIDARTILHKAPGRATRSYSGCVMAQSVQERFGPHC